MKKALLILGMFLGALPLTAQVLGHHVGKARQWQRTDFTVHFCGQWENPYLQEDIALDIVLTAPSGKTLTVPCFHVDGETGAESTWSARFLPQEKGIYSYKIVYSEQGNRVPDAAGGQFRVRAPKRGAHGILHACDNWTFRADDGTPFRGVGENLCWESRENDDSRYFKALHEQHDRFNYDAMLPKFAANGGNFTRFWMCPWNFPIDRKQDFNNLRYTASEAYYNPSAVERLDHVLSLAESLDLKVMLCLGPGDVPAGREFFVADSAKTRYRNYLRYIVARWGYSPTVGAWEFFNEVDNVQFADPEHPIPADDIVAWHREMAAYLKDLDPYGHIVTTSISHRDLEGLNDIPDIDLNQKHIYCATAAIPGTIAQYEAQHGKPYVIGEFGYEWDWSKNFDDFAEGMETDFRRGLWYGLFSPTPVTPMSWWWEWFDEHGTVGYFRNIRLVSDRMLKAGKGRFEPVEVSAEGGDAFGVRCGDKTWIYVYNSSGMPVTLIGVDGPVGQGKIRTLDFNKAVFRRMKTPVYIPPKGEALYEIK